MTSCVCKWISTNATFCAFIDQPVIVDGPCSYSKMGRLDEKSDIYSFGVVLLEMITGHKPSDPSADPLFIRDWVRKILSKSWHMAYGLQFFDIDE